MKTTKRIFAVLICVTMIISVIPAISVSATTYSGTCGDNLTWALNTDTGVLTISGTGDMTNYISPFQPWYSYRTSITSAVISDGVTSIGDCAFSNCESLTSITIPEGSTSIDETLDNTTPDPFVDDGDDDFWILSGITIPDTVISIGNFAFSNCAALTSITIPNSVTSIGIGAFQGCTSLASITIPGSVTNINNNTFGVCTSLTSITIPNSVTSIGDDAFSNCTSLTDVYYNGSEDAWNSVAIGSNNTYLTSATIHYSESSSFDTTRDVWNFSNNYDAFGNASEGYQIFKSDYDRLISNLSPTDRTSITTSNCLNRYNVMEDDLNLLLTVPLFKSFPHCQWGGSCYGMSVWVCLAKNNIISSTDIDASASTLYDIDSSLKTESAINYYQGQEYLPSVISEATYCMSLSQYQQIQNLETLAKSANNGGSPFLIGLSWYECFNADGSCDTSSGKGHMIVGYGLEKGSFNCTEPSGSTGTYDRKVLIYDCSYPNGGDDFDLYYNSSTGKWCIPGHGIVSTSSQTRNNIYNNGIIDLITSNTSTLNSVDYNTGEINISLSPVRDYTTVAALSDASYTISWGDYSCTIEGLTVTENTSDEDIHVIMSSNIDTDGNSHESTASIVLPSGDYSYTVTSDDSLAFSINYGDHLETVTSTSGGTVTFNADGETSVSLDNAADCTISLTSNDLATTYDTFVVTSAEASEVTATLADGGMVVTSDNANDVSVFGLNASDSSGIAIAEGSENMLITETDDGTLSAWSDEDNSGEYTTAIESEIIVTTWEITGYSNGTVTLTAPSDAEGDYYVTIAQYDDAGILIDCEIAVLTAESEKTYYQITTEKALSTGKIKIMLWDKNLIPLTKAFEY